MSDYIFMSIYLKEPRKGCSKHLSIFRLFNNDTSEELIFLLAMLEVSLLVLIIALFLFLFFT